jgi:hypothetical protein
MSIQNPKQAKPEELVALNSLVTGGSFVRIDDRLELPETLQPYASGRSKCVVVASSDFSSSASSIAAEYAPNGPVVLFKNYRYCEHDRSPHLNVDDHAFWQDRQGNPWKASSRDAPDHYREIVAGTAVSDVWDAYGIPQSKSGSLADFRKQGAHLDFVKPCPGLRHLRSGTEPERSGDG